MNDERERKSQKRIHAQGGGDKNKRGHVLRNIMTNLSSLSHTHQSSHFARINCSETRTDYYALS
jgi:hypothetical protein